MATTKQELNEKIYKEKVLLYSSTGCPDCIKTREFFLEKGIKCEVVDISKMPSHKKVQQALQEMTGQSIPPYIFIGGHLIGNYNQLEQQDKQGVL